ncbi:hypothetical protein FISHEDRAFT_60058 [Fistulina hepatica ATCC 64428]|uniref:Uncharacterized protein n=1 Tax=Fistulina hepatica ATCC 64428 TaxID=1128425 RepID=A0A0D7A7Q1_9AGAR|nr:hypothetical protein FISHEDRAFT_60058 [Fistulina hepatica ATCC 64428]
MTSLLDFLKPYPREASERARNNARFVLLFLVATFLLPVPSIFTALRRVAFSPPPEPWSWRWVVHCFYWLELGIVGIAGLNIAQCVYALQYPRPVPPHQPQKMKRDSMASPTPTKRPLKSITPVASPQRPFSSPSQSLYQSLGSSTHPVKSSYKAPTGPSSDYPPTPASTPSRVLHYSMPPATPMNSVASSSTSSVLSTPSPTVFSEYLTKRGSIPGRPLDGRFLERMNPEEDEDEDEVMQ